MNIFRMAGDVAHIVSIIILLHSIETTQSVNGLSLKTQVLYTIVFISRYLDLFYRYISLYNSFMKVFYISSSIYTVYLIANKYNKSIKEHVDNFEVKYLLGPSFILGFLFNYGFTLPEILWSFSLWLEAVAILPQLFMLQKTGEAEVLTTHYIFALGLYRALYIPNWFYRYFAEDKFDKLAVLTGIIQTVIYSDFFYIYYKSAFKGKKFKLPV
ncbi:hypothetical protein BABINDRAFT_166263 [Babjeviella inositovora NRRL Y-12698]|uniref:ER lumen protein-retaining receptor n=1 Tax=Babjeviella inositovora NRRL Y-12698 TaxID=984486 RepID=A0A1E3QSK0_9ASCO|nr:uncharacterized protein BABINDRAFT_166263 [Babjeviella inositovora NRRL Y-12698]ODQ80661.1 hypothetical protein BABINDRAFT_166263 [Babjeviella inositovora NRRL Y-12698]